MICTFDSNGKCLRHKGSKHTGQKHLAIDPSCAGEKWRQYQDRLHGIKLPCKCKGCKDAK